MKPAGKPPLQSTLKVIFGVARMSTLTVESSRIEGSGFIRGISCVSVFPPDPDAPEPSQNVDGIRPDDCRYPIPKEEETASCSSSIGRNSSSGGSTSSVGEDSEVQSSYKGPLDTMDSLEEYLPIRRGISKFYCGKSKSFTCIADAESAKDLAKPDNIYNRKRKNLLAFSNYWDRHRHCPPISTGRGVSKKATNSSRSTLALTIAISSSESNTSDEHEPRLPPLHPQGKSSIASPPKRSLPSRSFSLTDLQGASSSICIGEKHQKPL